MQPEIAELLNKGNNLFDEGRFEEAISCYDKVLSLDLKNFSAWNNKGTSLSNLGRFEEAVTCYDEALKINSDAETWISKGNSLCELDRLQEAIQCFDEATEIDPKNLTAWVCKANSFKELAFLKKEKRCRHKAQRLQLEQTNILLTKGNKLFNLGDFEEALQCYTEALELDSEFASAWLRTWLGCSNLDPITNMANPKFQEQIKGILHIAKCFQNYPRTSTTLIKLATTFATEKEMPDLDSFKCMCSLPVTVFRDEFVASDDIGKDYRMKCYDDVFKILSTIPNVDKSSLLAKDLDEFFSRLNDIDKSLTPMAESLQDLRAVPKRTAHQSMVLFHTTCYLYLIGFEAVFDDVLKMLLLILEASQGKVRKFEEIEMRNIRRLPEDFEKDFKHLPEGFKLLFGISPNFLETNRFRERIDIRNAIAHAQAQYNPETNEIHFRFITTNDDNNQKTVNYTKMSLDKFHAIHFEILDVIDSFRYQLLLIDAMKILSYLYSCKTSSCSD